MKLTHMQQVAWNQPWLDRDKNPKLDQRAMRISGDWVAGLSLNK